MGECFFSSPGRIPLQTHPNAYVHGLFKKVKLRAYCKVFYSIYYPDKGVNKFIDYALLYSRINSTFRVDKAPWSSLV
jgi:hypothetical protein